jgi:guanylate kinase
MSSDAIADGGGEGIPIVLSGPSGVGKNSVIDGVLECVSGLSYCISTTSRPPRPEETEGIDYHFLTRDEFEAAISEGDFLEWAEVHGQYYGTQASTLEGQLSSGDDVILQKDVQGGVALREFFPGSLFIYIVPPGMEKLRDRLKRRGSDSDEEIDLRLSIVLKENRMAHNYTHLVVNDNLDEAIQAVRHIILADRYRRTRVFPVLVQQGLLEEKRS